MTEKLKRYPVIETFGPTIQGEGVDQGCVSIFVRFGGCDFRCEWCDTPHAVIPAEVRANAEKLTRPEIMRRVLDHTVGPRGDDLNVPWVILSGGNPALHELGDLVEALHSAGFLVAVETQGTRWKRWLADCDRVCVSPKPPSAGQRWSWDDVGPMIRRLDAVARGRDDDEWAFVKVPCFNERDLDFAVDMRLRRLPSTMRLFLTAGNDAGRTVGQPDRVDERGDTEVKLDLIKGFRWLVDTIIDRYPELCRDTVTLQVQDHVLLWGNELGH